MAMTGSRPPQRGQCEDIEIEHAAHQRGPGPRPWGAGVAGAGVDVLCLEVGLWAPVADDLRVPARVRGEDAVIQKYVHRGEKREASRLTGAGEMLVTLDRRDRIVGFLGNEVSVVNIGLEAFALDLAGRNVPVVHVAWKPPARGNLHLTHLLSQLAD